jgi:hypothetical protein
MDKKLLAGWWRLTLPIPPAIWHKMDQGAGGHMDFMSKAHHRVRDYVVLELPRSGKPLTPERIAQELQLPLDQVVDILDDLERHKTFLFRDPQGAVTWAYPVTVDPTPHRVRFDSGEQVYAA